MDPGDDTPALAVMGTIPIYWGEAADLGEVVADGTHAHWARAQLEQHYRLVPLDYLDGDALAGQSRLLLAQPRVLSPEENVALDAWVRGGGRLLLFADPMMTGASRFAIGDRRRPQDVTVLSPILAHWGLELQFDADQADAVELREIAGGPVPVALAGRFAATSGEALCTLDAGAVWAVCRVGQGEVGILADAALLDIAGPHQHAPEALDRLAASVFGVSGENAGEAAAADPVAAERHANPPISASARSQTAGPP